MLAGESKRHEELLPICEKSGQSTLLNRDKKIKVFNACVKSELLYVLETWLGTNELRRKFQTLINKCLRYILKIWLPRTISNRELWQLSGQTDNENLDGLSIR
jgi:hypothetical protein